MIQAHRGRSAPFSCTQTVAVLQSNRASMCHRQLQAKQTCVADLLAVCAVWRNRSIQRNPGLTAANIKGSHIQAMQSYVTDLPSVCAGEAGPLSAAQLSSAAGLNPALLPRNDGCLKETLQEVTTPSPLLA